MPRGFDDLVTGIREVDVPKGLQAAVLSAVDHADRRRSRLHQAALVATVPSLVATFLALRFLVAEASTSSFMTVLGLIASDGSYVVTELGSWLTALAETLPVTGLLVLSVAVFLFALILEAAVVTSRSAWRASIIRKTT